MAGFCALLANLHKFHILTKFARFIVIPKFAKILKIRHHGWLLGVKPIFFYNLTKIAKFVPFAKYLSKAGFHVLNYFV